MRSLRPKIILLVVAATATALLACVRTSPAVLPSILISPSLSGTTTNFHGGVVIFLHIPKTGGTTIRDNFSNRSRFPNVEFTGVYVEQQMKSVHYQIEKHLVNRQSTQTLFVEIHDRSETSTLKALAPQLRKWRQRAHKVQRPFSAFTILRDPVDLAVSLFNFFHVVGGVFGNEQFERLNGTLPNFQRVFMGKTKDHVFYYSNPQCLYLLRGELFHSSSSSVVSESECQWVLETLQETMDWVGDTKTLSQETLPLLQKLLAVSDAAATAQEVLPSAYQSNTMRYGHDRHSVQLLHRRDLDSVTLQWIQDQSQYDQAMYETVVQHKPATRGF